MTSAATATAEPTPPGPGFKEFVCLIAAMMALNALAIDSMLPALPDIGMTLGVADDNQRQWIITAYLLGFGAAQILYGALADWYGRKPVLVVGVSIYVAFSVLAALATSFEWLLMARVGQGVGAAATRVLAVSIVRDRYSGRTMARVMSLTLLVFLGVPILAPAMGQAVLMVAPWPWIFALLALAGVAILIWAGLRLPETLDPANRMPIRAGRIASAFKEALTHRVALGYTLASTAIAGALFGFLNSSQQIFYDVFERPGLFTTVFAGIAGFIAIAAVSNARLVERLGSRLISHSALMGFIALPAIHAVVAITGHETVWTFAVLQALTMLCFGFIAGNFGAMAMQPMGHIAGTAASVQGVISTVGGALTGFVIGQQFDGSVVPMTVGFTLCGIVALGFVLLAEGGRLFTARNPAPVSATP